MRLTGILINFFHLSDVFLMIRSCYECGNKRPLKQQHFFSLQENIKLTISEILSWCITVDIDFWCFVEVVLIRFFSFTKLLSSQPLFHTRFFNRTLVMVSPHISNRELNFIVLFLYDVGPSNLQGVLLALGSRIAPGSAHWITLGSMCSNLGQPCARLTDCIIYPAPKFHFNIDFYVTYLWFFNAVQISLLWLFIQLLIFIYVWLQGIVFLYF